MNRNRLSIIFILVFVISFIIGDIYIVINYIIPHKIELSNSVSGTYEVNNYTFTSVDKSYFKDALFIGDSRTVGIKEYGGLNRATFFTDIGMSSYNIYNKKIVVSSLGKVNLKELLQTQQFGKVYVMLGLNELGYDLDTNVQKYQELINMILKYQPNTIIYIEANLHVAEKRSSRDIIFNNGRINQFNNLISKIANNENIFYIDVNELFDDENGNLKLNYTYDYTHVYAKYYSEWVEWLCQHVADI